MDEQRYGALSKYAEDGLEIFIEELCEFLSIPSISTDEKFIAEVNRAAVWLEDHLRYIGVDKTQIFKTLKHPIVYAEYWSQSNLPTVLIYGHYDVQPVDPLEEWKTAPFSPGIRDNAIYARGAVDDKGQLFMILKAVEAYLKSDQPFPVNLKFIFEGEEETGSESMEAFLKDNKTKLKADVALICDSAMIKNNVPTIIYGIKGFVGLEVILTGSQRDLHSGVFGGGIDNPINALCSLLGELKDDKGRITIPGFYDQVEDIGEKEKKLFADIPFDAEELKSQLGLKKFKTEAGYSYVESTTARPTLDVNGISGGYQGQGFKAVIPSVASAKISMRLVPGQDPNQILQLVKEHLLKKAPDSMTISLKDRGLAYPALINISHPGLSASAQAMEAVFGNKTIFMRDGGSLPIVTYLKSILGVESILMGFGLKSDGPHAPNEHFGLDRFMKGILSLIRFFSLYPEYADGSIKTAAPKAI